MGTSNEQERVRRLGRTVPAQVRSGTCVHPHPRGAGDQEGGTAAEIPSVQTTLRSCEKNLERI